MTHRPTLRTLMTGILLSATLALASGCVEARGRVYVRLGPPTPIVDVRGVSPGPGYVWIDGYHRWDGGAYAWVPGRWDRAPRPRAVWVAGHWSHDSRGWYYVEGRWR